MPVIEQQQTIQTLEILREEEIAAPIDVVFETLLEQMGPYNETPDKVPLPMKLEPWPGGRWFRDLGENNGHWWGNVQAIKAPTLLEICGPLFMSYPATSNVQYRLSEENGITRLKFAHRAIGWMPAEMTEGVNRGWDHILTRLRERALNRNDRRNDRPRTTARGESHAASVNGFAPVRMEDGGQMTVVGLKGHFSIWRRPLHCGALVALCTSSWQGTRSSGECSLRGLLEPRGRWTRLHGGRGGTQRRGRAAGTGGREYSAGRLRGLCAPRSRLGDSEDHEQSLRMVGKE